MYVFDDEYRVDMGEDLERIIDLGEDKNAKLIIGKKLETTRLNWR